MAKDEENIVSSGNQFCYFDAQLSLDVIDILSEFEDSALINDRIFISDDSDVKCEDVLGSWDTVRHQACSNVEPETPPKKKHCEVTSAHAGDSSINFVASNIQNAKLYGQHSKSTNIQYNNASLWRSCVEPKTYRYIVNNGKYRSSKALVQNYGGQKPPRKSTDTKILNPEQKKLQKEIQRELRREFELSDRLEQWNRHKETGKLYHGGSDHSRTPSPDPRPSGDTNSQNSQRKLTENTQDVHKQRKDNVDSSVVLPPINVPLVSNGSPHRGNLTNNPDAFRDFVHHFDTMVTKRSRQSERPVVMVSRSRSEPPHPATRTSHSNIETDLEISPTTFRRDMSILAFPAGHKGVQSRGSTIHLLKKHLDPDSENMDDVRALSEQNNNEHRKLFTEGSQIDMIHKQQRSSEEMTPQPANENQSSPDSPMRSRKGSNSSRKSDGSSQMSNVPLTQIKYMAASGEVSKIPKFGRNSGETSSDDFYSTLEKDSHAKQNPRDMCTETNIEVKSTTDALKSVMTTKFIAPMPLRDVPIQKLHSHRSSHLFTDSNSTKLVSGGFRAVPVAQMKLNEKKQQFEPNTKELEILPQISGRKVTMATTSHRIV